MLPQRFTVNGTGQSLGWNDIVVQAVDNQGRVLNEVRTKLQGQDVGAGGPGTWAVAMDVYAAPGTPGKLRVTVPGRDILYELRVEVAGFRLDDATDPGGFRGWLRVPHCGGLVALRQQRRSQRPDHVTWFWRHWDNASLR